MPRPGPRPYECVRRAWHSDRHHPLRGSLIQEIFRLVSEAHKTETRKNKEWQEKLPCVVLRVEEIMYSKANSEAEYSDLTTLWQRANEAVDTIIRRDQDDDNENHDNNEVPLLHPCIEAALNLGCIPRRASRSQRNSNPISYLSSSARQAAHPVNSEFSQGRTAAIRALLMQPPKQSSVPHFISDSTCDKTTSNQEIPFPTSEFTIRCQEGSQPLQKESCAWPRSGCVYPLYYSDSLSETGSLKPLQKTQETTHAATSIQKKESCFLQNFETNKVDESSFFKEDSKRPLVLPCDLSLCLGLPSALSFSAESCSPRAVDLTSSSSCDVSKSSDQSANIVRVSSFPRGSFTSLEDRCLDLFHRDSYDDPLESCSSKWSSVADGISNTEPSGKKHKQLDSVLYGQEHVSLKQKLLI